jgi:hypothetical protein
MVMFGLAVQMAGKVWFIDRMAILYDDLTPALTPNGGRPPQTSITRQG